jgi:general secretion pathway protein A
MYEKFYNFFEKPFNTTPDSKFFFPSPKHAEAMNSLLYAINERKGFVVITGEIGAGKTTVVRAVLNKLGVNTRVAMITNTFLTNKELIAEILDEFDIEHTGGTKQKLLAKLNQFLIQQLSADANIVLIIDEAQNLSTKVLEEVRMLSNLETEKEKLIQIILLGQPQLRAKLENPRLEQFKQRISVYYHLNALNSQEAKDYIQHRLKMVTVGIGAPEIFSNDAIELIYEYSRGIPRLINQLCDSALLSGYAYDKKLVTTDIVREVIKERELNYSHETQVPVQKQSNSAAVTHCCPSCARFKDCSLKWDRGSRGEEQLCCASCQDYFKCVSQSNAVQTK